MSQSNVVPHAVTASGGTVLGGEGVQWLWDKVIPWIMDVPSLALSGAEVLAPMPGQLPPMPDTVADLVALVVIGLVYYLAGFMPRTPTGDGPLPGADR